MKPLLILLLLLIPLVHAQEPAPDTNEPPLVVLSSKWARDRQPVANAVSASASVPPQPAITRESKNFEKQKRVNAPAGDRDPMLDTVDARAGELERINQLARAAQDKPTIAGFTYQLKVQNGGTKITQSVFWEYRFREMANPRNEVSRQFICSVKIKPSQEKSLEAFSSLGPSEVIDVKSLGKKAEFEAAVLINRVEFSDGTFWQRKDWEVNQLRLNEKARAVTRNLPMCRGL